MAYLKASRRTSNGGQRSSCGVYTTQHHAFIKSNPPPFLYALSLSNENAHFRQCIVAVLVVTHPKDRSL